MEPTDIRYSDPIKGTRWITVTWNDPNVESVDLYTGDDDNLKLFATCRRGEPIPADGEPVTITRIGLHGSPLQITKELLDESRSQWDMESYRRRIVELIEANNREVEKRRAAEAEALKWRVMAETMSEKLVSFYTKGTRHEWRESGQAQTAEFPKPSLCPPDAWQTEHGFQNPESGQVNPAVPCHFENRPPFDAELLELREGMAIWKCELCQAQVKTPAPDFFRIVFGKLHGKRIELERQLAEEKSHTADAISEALRDQDEKDNMPDEDSYQDFLSQREP